MLNCRIPDTYGIEGKTVHTAYCVGKEIAPIHFCIVGYFPVMQEGILLGMIFDNDDGLVEMKLT